MSSDRVHLSVAEARALGERALRGIGYDAEEARIVCDHVIDAALCGYEYSGSRKNPEYPGAPPLRRAPPQDAPCARDRGLGAVRRRQQ